MLAVLYVVGTESEAPSLSVLEENISAVGRKLRASKLLERTSSKLVGIVLSVELEAGGDETDAPSQVDPVELSKSSPLEDGCSKTGELTS